MTQPLETPALTRSNHLSKTLTRTLALIAMLALLMPALATAADAEADAKPAVATTDKPDIPVLNWQERSDWTNVKTDITPAAVGDGVADDSDALQAALDSVKTGSVLYFPAGKYRITKPLFLGMKKRLISISLIGHGRDTKLIWDGEADATMLTVNSGSMSRYVGISFDGQNKAARGYYSYNIEKGSFITELQFKDLAFRNFTQAAIYYEAELKGYTKTPDKYATAEVVYNNCLFENVKKGIYSASFNDLDHTFTGCEFRNCGTGIFFVRGNYYVRNTRFENSSEVDIQSRSSEHGVSVRRVTSTGSKMFLDFGSSVGVITVENCRVDNWTNPQGVMHIRCPSALIFDNVFQGPNDSQSPVSYLRQSGTRIMANNTMTGSTNLFFQDQASPRSYHYKADAVDKLLPDGYESKYLNLIELPKTDTFVEPAKIAIGQSFLKTTREIPGKIFDAKVDFGAIGNGKVDDTQAIQKTIDAAREYGQNAIAYIPSGKYNISKTIHITGENYTVGGTGYASSFIWKGDQGGHMVEVTAPKNLVIEGLAIGQADYDHNKGTQSRDLIQMGVKEATSIIYKRVLVYGRYMRNIRRGLELSNLGPLEHVVFEEVQGNININNSAQATILGNVSYEGTLTIQGASKERTGFTGFMTRLATGVAHALVIKNNQSAVLSDFYVEQAPSIYWFEGTPDDPAGRVTMESPKIDATGSAKQMEASHIFDVDGFTGSIYLGPSAYYVNPREMQMSLRGNAKADLFFLGNVFYESGPVFLEKSPTINVHWLGTRIVGKENAAARNEAVKTNVTPEDYHKYSVMLDDLRTLGVHDIKTNFPWLGQ